MQATLGQQAQTMQGAGFGIRLVAYLIDGFIGFIIGFFVGMVFPDQTMSTILGIAVGFVYNVGFWTSMGATPGKMAMGLRVVDAQTGEILGPGQAVLRYIGYIPSALAIGLGFLWILWDPKRQGWHDKIAGTLVVKV